MSTATISYVTGTDTGVGKTVATAALAAALAARGASVAVYKPTQTGVAENDPGDMAEVARLSGVAAVHEGIRLRDPMAPVAAALRELRSLPTMEQHLARITELAKSFDHVLVEGAGGVLVELDTHGHTLADLAALTVRGEASGVVVVCRAGLGTLNHTLLTLEALAHRGLSAPALMIGSWPVAPSYLEMSNSETLQGYGAPWLGSLPAGASGLDPQAFRHLAPKWLQLPGWARGANTVSMPALKGPTGGKTVR